ncbi:uncharacterized protein [Epargyreus clarus]|uniref:uncharacterized protein isoform X2 n=1 Tax=Epargyreus clarus TaxID=520877 RepID=UPI003C2EA18B
MSASSASSPRRRVADIIDLDRYMRSAVKPSRDYREHFVVDAGGVDRAPHYSSGCSDSSALPPALTPALTPAPAHRTAPSTHNKRFSHDSGLSDGSYVRRRQKSHRRKPDVLSKQRDQPLPPYSSPSVREFRVACEKALREQQEQIARVAELCERLAQPAPGGDRDAAQRARVEKTGHRSRAGQKEKAGDSSDTSDLSSSSSSQVRRKDKRRSESCKTYKIIMSKLDELNRLFAARRATSPAPARCPSPCPSPPRRAVSSRSVSVCDKVVATEPLNRNVNRAVTPTVQTVLTPRDQRCSEYAASVDGRSVLRGQRSASSKERARSPLPHNYDLDNPIHFYEQAKRLQALHASPQRSPARRSEPATHDSCEDHAVHSKYVQYAGYEQHAPYTQRESSVQHESHAQPESYVQHESHVQPESYVQHESYAERESHAKCDSHAERASVCAACRGYWRALCRHLPALLRTRLF